MNAGIASIQAECNTLHIRIFCCERLSVACYRALQEECDSVVSGLPASPGIQLQRFKGLGEMMPQQLWDTTVDPPRWTLKLVTVDDAAAADW